MFWRKFAYLACTGGLLASVPVWADSSYPWEARAIDVFPDHNAAARGSVPATKMIEDGRRLFEARFTTLDGAGRPGATGDSKPTIRLPSHAVPFIRTAGPDANSCAGCHNQPRVGGSGDFAVNVFVGAHFTDPPTDSLSAAVTNERNTLTTFGTGAIEMLAREMTEDLLAQRAVGLRQAIASGALQTVQLETKGVRFGSITVRPDGSYDTKNLEGVDPDLVIKPFGVRGVVISLREFTINALNQHHGIQAIERFGWERTGRRDFDEDGVEDEFTVGQVTALTLFQASLPVPGRSRPTSPEQARRVRDGEGIFQSIGCAECHRPFLPLKATEFSEPNPFNRPGNLRPEDAGTVRIPLVAKEGTGLTRAPTSGLRVAAFTDLKRHRICDDADPFFCNERLRQDFVPTDQFITMKLWDAGTSMPYGHRGDCTTLTDAILHHSAEGANSKNAFVALATPEKAALIEFLRSLVVTDVAVAESSQSLTERSPTP